ncbi:MAG TPA: molybdopterin-dependent oxidoreductase [Terriglobales bacterium]|nr:molybdopterin-dependent oxidoreductase [Terriglobales bacterium]
MAQTLTTCTFCGVGCGLYLESSDGRVVGAYPSLSHPANSGRLCVRGWHVHEVCSSPDRLRSPLLRRNGTLEEVGWDEALGFVADKLMRIRARDGPDALAFLNSPRCANEESYLLQKLARAAIGTNNVDHGSGVYCHNSINVLLETLGLPATTNSISDLANSEVIVVDGVDLARRLPVIAGAVLRAKLSGAKLIVIGSRYHRIARSADLFLQVLPGTEAMLYGALAKAIVDRGLMNHSFIHKHCRDYESFLAHIRLYDVFEAAESCGVSPDLIEEAAQVYAGARCAAVLYSTGIESRTRDSIRAIVNLALLTGNLGKRGAGIFALTEHNNLQGVCDMGVLPDRLPGYRPVGDARARAEVEALWKTTIPSSPGFGARSMLTDRGDGSLKALWLCRCDPFSTAFFGDPANSLRHFELIVVQHLFMTGTAEYAHVVLPTTSFGEERVSFTSTERRIQLAERAVAPPPGPLPAWEQLVRVARLLGADWSYRSSAEVMDEIGAVVPFYSGVNYRNLGSHYGRQWPCTKEQPLGTSLLFGNHNGNHAFRFAAVAKPTIIPPPPEFPLILVFGQSLYYWNQSVLIQHSETLRREHRILLLDYPQGFVEINPADAQALGIHDGQKVRLVSPDAAAVSTARVTDEVRRGTVCVPYFVREVERQILGSVAGGAALVWIRLEKEAA